MPRVSIVLIVALAAGLLPSCNKPSPPPHGGAEKTATATGKLGDPPSPRALMTAGCRTGYFLIQQLAEAYKRKTGVDVRVSPTGNKVAMTQLLSGEIDFAECCKTPERLAETMPEVNAALDRLSAHLIAKDALAVIVHPDNPTEDLSLEKLAAVYRGEIGHWQELGWREGGEVAPCRIDPQVESGVALLFRELTIGKKGELSDRCVLAPSDNHMPRLVAKLPLMVGYCALGKLPDTVKPISIGGVEPTAANVRNGRYPLVATYYLITLGTPADGVRDFVDYALGSEGQAIVGRDFMEINE